MSEGRIRRLDDRPDSARDRVALVGLAVVGVLGVTAAVVGGGATQRARIDALEARLRAEEERRAAAVQRAEAARRDPATVRGTEPDVASVWSGGGPTRPRPLRGWFVEEAAPGVGGGRFAPGAWVPRKLAAAGGALRDHGWSGPTRIAVPAGTWHVAGFARARSTAHQVRLYDATAGRVLLVGTVAGPGAYGTDTASTVGGRLVLTADLTVLELQHRSAGELEPGDQHGLGAPDDLGGATLLAQLDLVQVLER